MDKKEQAAAVKAPGLPSSVRVRFVRVRLATGAFEVLVASLPDEPLFPTAGFLELWRGASTGLLILPTRLLRGPRIAVALSFEQEIIPRIIDSEGLFAYDNGERFCLDIGTPERSSVMHKWGSKIAERLRI